MTADEPRVKVTTNLAFGICLILLGTTLMLDRLQLVDASQLLRFWPVALVLFGGALVIQSFQRVDATAAPQQGFPAGLLILFVLVGLFASQGVSRGVTATDSSDTINLFAVMGRHQHISSAPVFRGGDMTTIMGRADLDLRNTTITPGADVEIEVFTLMGGGTIRVPEDWVVEIRSVPIMGGVNDRRGGARDVAGQPRIVIRGLIMMGGLQIRS